MHLNVIISELYSRDMCTYIYPTDLFPLLNMYFISSIVLPLYAESSLIYLRSLKFFDDPRKDLGKMISTLTLCTLLFETLFTKTFFSKHEGTQIVLKRKKKFRAAYTTVDCSKIYSIILAKDK